MKTQMLTLTPSECDHLLRYLKQPQNSHRPPRIYNRNYTMAVVMLDTGCRVGELCKLRQDQFWFADAPVQALTIEKDQAKNKVERTIPTTIRLRDAIGLMQSQWWSKDTVLGERSAFYSIGCQYPLSPRQVQRIIKEASIASIGREVHPHMLRHTFATRLMTKTSMRIIQELLGHSNITSTQIYTHPNGDDCRNAIDKLNEGS